MNRKKPPGHNAMTRLLKKLVSVPKEALAAKATKAKKK